MSNIIFLYASNSTAAGLCKFILLLVMLDGSFVYSILELQSDIAQGIRHIIFLLKCIPRLPMLIYGCNKQYISIRNAKHFIPPP